MGRAVATTPLQDERFLLLGSLGRGGMGAVFRAFDRVGQEMVALKAQGGDELAGPAHPLSSEFDACTRLVHPNVVKVYELGIARSGPIRPGSPYLVMEHLAGRPANRVLPPGRIDPALIGEFAVEVLRGLDHVHRAGLVHRDLKPENILVTRSKGKLRQVKLTDFGLAIQAGSAEPPGTISGSLSYMAPESLLGMPLDGRADLYAVGLLLFQLATGEQPVPAGGVNAALRWHLAGPPADPNRLRPRLPGRLARFIRRLTARDREERPADARTALAMLGFADPSPERPPLAGRGRALQAQLRLALDATRLGARRIFRLPACPLRAGALLREVRVWSQIHGLCFQRLGPGPASPQRHDLGRLALHLLLARPDETQALTERYGLDRALPFQLIGGLAVWDHTRSEREPLGPDGLRAAARRVCRFLLDCASRRALVLHIEPGVGEDCLAGQVVRGLKERIGGGGGPQPGRGGLLLLIDER